MSPQTLHSLASAAVVGGLAWLVVAAMNVAMGTSEAERLVLSGIADYVLLGGFAGALVLTVPGVLALHAHQRGDDGPLGRSGTLVATVGITTQTVIIMVILIDGRDRPWFDIAAPLAILTWIVGSLMLGVAIHRAGVMPRWVGIALPLVTLVAVTFAAFGTSVLIGAFLIAVGARIARAARAGSTARPSVRTSGPRSQ